MSALNPTWPSLYNPGLEVLHFMDRNATQPGGVYLTDTSDVFLFTLYWTLVFYTPFFILGGLYAFLNITFPPRSVLEDRDIPESHPLTMLRPSRDSTEAANTPLIKRKPRKENEGRSRLTFALLVLLAFAIASLAGSLISAAIVGYILVGLYKSAGFFISTWVPFLWALLHTLISILSIWPSVIDIA